MAPLLRCLYRAPGAWWVLASRISGSRGTRTQKGVVMGTYTEVGLGPDRGRGSWSWSGRFGLAHLANL
jgi:hypothetical protein